MLAHRVMGVVSLYVILLVGRLNTSRGRRGGVGGGDEWGGFGCGPIYSYI